MITRTTKLTSTTQILSAWELGPTYAIGDNEIDGAGHTLAMVAKPGERKDRLALAMGPFDGSEGDYTLRDLRVEGSHDVLLGETCDGVVIRGRAIVRNLTITGIAGMWKMPSASSSGGGGNREVFGFRTTQNDFSNHELIYGGHDIQDLTVVARIPDSYVSAICIAQVRHPKRQISLSTVRRARVLMAQGNHASLTGLNDTLFDEGYANESKYFYYCDTGCHSGVTVCGWKAWASRAAVGIGTLDGNPKENLTIADTDVYFVGDGPFYAAELFDDRNLARSIHFKNVRFHVPRGAVWWRVSTTGTDEPWVTFKNCTMPHERDWHPNVK